MCRTPLTRRMPAASSGLSRPAVAASYAMRRTAAWDLREFTGELASINPKTFYVDRPSTPHGRALRPSFAGRYNRAMRVRLDYGSDGLEVDLPDDRVTIIEPRARPAVPDSQAALAAALRAPIAGPPLRDLASRGVRVAISVCDITRAQPRREMLRALLDEMPGVRSLETRRSRDAI